MIQVVNNSFINGLTDDLTWVEEEQIIEEYAQLKEIPFEEADKIAYTVGLNIIANELLEVKYE